MVLLFQHSPTTTVSLSYRVFVLQVMLDRACTSSKLLIQLTVKFLYMRRCLLKRYRHIFGSHPCFHAS